MSKVRRTNGFPEDETLFEFAQLIVAFDLALGVPSAQLAVA